jgi:hypothetical protein
MAVAIVPRRQRRESVNLPGESRPINHFPTFTASSIGFAVRCPLSPCRKLQLERATKWPARTASYGKGSPRSMPSTRNLTLPLARSPAPSLTEVRRESLSVGAAGSGGEMASTG